MFLITAKQSSKTMLILIVKIRTLKTTLLREMKELTLLIKKLRVGKSYF